MDTMGLLLFTNDTAGDVRLLLCQWRETPAFFSFLLSAQVTKQFKYAEEFTQMSRGELEFLAQLTDFQAFWTQFWKASSPELSEAAKMFCSSPKLQRSAARILRWMDEGKVPEKLPAWALPRGRKRPAMTEYRAAANDFVSNTGIDAATYGALDIAPVEDEHSIYFYAYSPFVALRACDPQADVIQRKWATHAEAMELLAGDDAIQRERAAVVDTAFQLATARLRR
eukprot:c55304_g1_i1.p1 GENE.c55304_g1_i1~~c55304_g1_i1.p1  ORF type:complete len:226 (+),score=59.83 c55304_g1_i1:1-678(+)